MVLGITLHSFGKGCSVGVNHPNTCLVLPHFHPLHLGQLPPTSHTGGDC